MNGKLYIRLRVSDRATHVSDGYAHAPFHYLPPRVFPGEPPLLTIVNSSGGVIGGDELDMRIDLDPGAMLTLRTQAATKLYRSRGKPARSLCRFCLGDDARLDYFPDEIIPFTGSDYEQRTTIELGPGAMALVGEVVTVGRLARGERLAFTRLSLDLRCTEGGRLLLRDRAEIRPAQQHLTSRAVLAAATVWGAFYYFTMNPVEAGLVERIDEALCAVESGVGGASRSLCGVTGRVASSSVHAVHESLQMAREVVLGDGALN
jgi:urease accessory protein